MARRDSVRSDSASAPRIFRSSTDMSAKSVRNTASSATMLIRLEAIWMTQSGAPASQESSHCFPCTKI